ncbi:hypothetical protein [Paenibacillus sp. FSL K6-2524]|uniref:hypothetical protein n=1 Tax=Paenibacillus sp. FSL K6-2524 TaxID=2954516 RepID=UPI0030FBC422
MNHKLKLAIICLFIAALVYYICEGSPWKRYEFKKTVLAYCEERFSQKIEVDKVKYSFKDNSYWVIAHPINNKEVKFKIFRFVDKLQNIDELTDYYLQASWEYDVNKELDPFVKSIYSKGDKGRISVDPTPEILEKYEKIPIPEPPSYQEIKQELKENTKIHIVINRLFELDNTDEEYSRMYKIIQFIKEREYIYDNVSISFYSKSNDDYKKWISFTFNSLDNVKNKEDIALFMDK